MKVSLTPRIRPALLCALLSLALLAIPSVLAAPVPPLTAGTLGVSLSFTPNPVSVGTQTQIQVSISGGVAPYQIWFNATIPGCTPPKPLQQNQSTNTYRCTPTQSGTFSAYLDAADSAGNHGSTSASLTVQGGGNTGGTGSGNGTGGFSLSSLQDLLPIVMIVTFVLLASVLAIAASLVALAILVPRRLKQLRKAIQGEPLKKVKAEEPKAEKPKDEPPKDDP